MNKPYIHIHIIDISSFQNETFYYATVPMITITCNTKWVFPVNRYLVRSIFHQFTVYFYFEIGFYHRA